jgi:TRAP-type mannitol/chloroaromatic compound transport system substrate-binding protein/TRAP-type mannitol/chloroaromatic compound transport system permease small subunit
MSTGVALAQSKPPEFTFRVATIDSRTSVYNTALGIPFAERVAQLTDGRVKIEIIEGGVLAPVLQIFQAVQDGRADGALGPASFLGGKDPTNLIIGSFPTGLGVDSLLPWFYAGGGEKLLTEHRRETMGLHSIVVGAGPTEIMAHSHKAIRTVEDLRGMKFRALGNWAAILRDEFGAAPTVVPGAEIYSMLEKRAIDAAEFSMPAENRARGYQDVAKFIILPGIHAPAWTFEFATKKEKWDALPEELKVKVQAAAKLVTYECMTQIIMDDFGAMAEIGKGKNEIIVLDKTFQDKARVASRKWATEAAAKAKAEGNPWPERVIQSLFPFQDRWQANSRYLLTDTRTWLPKVDAVVRLFALIAMAQIAVMVFVMMYEVVARYGFGRPTLWSGDIIYMMNGTLFLLGAGWTLQQNQHVRIDFLSTRLPVRLQHLINLVFYLVLFLPLLWLVGRATFDKALNAYVKGELEQMSAWEPVIWPFYTGLLIGLVVLGVQVAAEAIRHGIGIVAPQAVPAPGTGGASPH